MTDPVESGTSVYGTMNSVEVHPDKQEDHHQEEQLSADVVEGQQGDGNDAPVMSRQLSVSEAAEAGTPRWVMPWPWRLIELPFRVPDPRDGRILVEATAWAMDSSGRGPLNQMGSYIGSAILRLSAIDAGCKKGPYQCSNTVHGLQPQSLLTAASSIVGVTAAILMPVIGAVVDHTPYRQHVGLVSGLLVVALVGVQISIDENNWFFILIVHSIQIFFMFIHFTAVFAYLPDLTTDLSVITHYAGQFNVRQFAVQLLFVCLLLLTGQVRGTNKVKTVAGTLQTAKDAAGISFGFGALFIGYAWLFLFRPRPALSQVPAGSNLLTTGFTQVARTSAKITKKYRALNWFMISLLWSPEAGSGVVVSIAVTFLTVFMKFSGQDIAKANLVLTMGSIVGALLSKKISMFLNPLNTYRLGLTAFAVSFAVSILVLDGPQRRGAVFGFAAAWGVTFGFTYSIQRVLLCTLIPKGQETEMMGMFTFCGQILGWLPPLIVTIMSEKKVSPRWFLSVVPIFCTVAVVCTLPMGDYHSAKALVDEESAAKLQEITSAANQRRACVTAPLPTDEASSGVLLPEHPKASAATEAEKETLKSTEEQTAAETIEIDPENQ